MEFALCTVRHVDVLYRSACHAHNMVVMPGEPLGKLVSSNTARPVMLLENPGVLEQRERPVQGRDGDEPRRSCGQLCRGPRPGSHLDCRHDRSSSGGVPDLGF